MGGQQLSRPAQRPHRFFRGLAQGGRGGRAVLGGVEPRQAGGECGQSHHPGDTDEVMRRVSRGLATRPIRAVQQDDQIADPARGRVELFLERLVIQALFQVRENGLVEYGFRAWHPCPGRASDERRPRQRPAVRPG